MTAPTTEAILDRLAEANVDPLDLLPLCQGPEYARHWQDARLCRAFARALISSGHPKGTIDLIRDKFGASPADLELRFLLSLAYARGGNPLQARKHLTSLLETATNGQAPAALKVEAYSLQGRLLKDRYRRTRDAKDAEQSASWYLQAHAQSDSLFPLINAATMLFLAGKKSKTRELAATVIKEGGKQERRSKKDDYWLWATLGEAHFLLGQLKEAGDCYRAAVKLAKNNAGDIAAMRGNYLLLRDKVELEDEIWQLFNVGAVVVFAGHMLDHPARKRPRFPQDPELQERVSQALRDMIQSLNARVGYCSAACGSDILFAERLLERDRAELHVVLPFHKEDFYRISIDFAPADWRVRCDYILARAKQVHYATTEHYLGDNVLFGFSNDFVQGLAATRAAERGLEPQAIVVLDDSSPATLGGTRYFLERWRRAGWPVKLIDLEKLRGEIRTPTLVRPDRSSAPASLERGVLKRQIKSMLFADVKGFSKLAEEESPHFHFLFLEEVVKVIRGCARPPDFCNTWGDGLYVVFDRVDDAADFALRLQEQLRHVDWSKVGISEAEPLRVGLHTGPVYKNRDPILKRTNYFGSHVVRAARIEPKTVPGCVFVSEQFAAAVAVQCRDRFVCEFIGMEELAKGYDRCPLYRLERVGEGVG